MIKTFAKRWTEIDANMWIYIFLNEMKMRLLYIKLIIILDLTFQYGKTYQKAMEKNRTIEKFSWRHEPFWLIKKHLKPIIRIHNQIALFKIKPWIRKLDVQNPTKLQKIRLKLTEWVQGIEKSSQFLIE